MMSLKTRLDRVQRRMIATMAAEQGLTYDELLEEAQLFFSLPLVEQLATIDDIHEELCREGMSMDDIDDMKAMLIREYRPI
jgi:hypothetical protein